MLERYGWNSDWAAQFASYAAQGFEPARVAVEHRGGYAVVTESGERDAAVTAKLRRAASSPADFPAVGDWVALKRREGHGRDHIHAVLPRRTKFSRRAAAATADRVEEQVVAANVDVVFIVIGLDADIDLHRLERYLALAHESGADPAVVLTKSDLCDDVPARIASVERSAVGVPVHAVSNVTGEGIDGLRPHFTGSRTVAALGASGVGKSSLVNSLTGGDATETGDVRRDRSGRHTTRRRQLIPIAAGGLFLDTPGMRELRLWEADEGVATTFPEIETLAESCRFGDCAHESEPGCAVLAAVERGELDAGRLESYRKLRDELVSLEQLRSPRR